MRPKLLLPLTLALLIGTAAIIYFAYRANHSPSLAVRAAATTDEDVKLSKKDRIDLAMQQDFDATKDPKLGFVPRERLYQAYRYAEAQRAALDNNGTMITPTWTERGPNNIGGRTRAIMIDPNDGTHKTAFAAGVAGGLWKTTDISASSPTWTVVNDFFENLAISCLTYDPTDPTTFYFGTGEGWFNSDAVTGDGIFKSTDGGATWVQAPNTSGVFSYVQKIVVDPATGDVYAATRNEGIQRSQDGGNNWEFVLGSGSGAVTNRSADLEIGADGTFYAAMGIFNTDGVYSSTTGNDGEWTKLNTGGNGFPTSGFERIELACAPSNANVLYALTQDASTNGIAAIYRSANKGSTWSTVSNPVDDDTDIGSDFTRGQGWYDLIAAVSPTDASGDTLMIGGIDLFKSANGGSSWTQISHWYGGFGHQYAHADQHAIVYQEDNPGVVYFGNDGGIYRSSDGNAAVPTISERNSSYNVTQFYSCAIHPDAGSNHFLAGAQDNGSHKFSSAGLGSTVEVTGGDGAWCHIDQDEPSYQFTQYVYSTFFRSVNGGSSFGSRITVSLSNGFFINPSDYDNDANVYYSAYSGGTYLRWTDPQTGTTFSSVSVTDFNGLRSSAITVSPNTANRVFFGTEGGRVVRVENANGSATSTHINSGSGMPTGTISCIAVEDGNDNHLLVTYSNYGVSSVWETTNGGGSWSAVEGNLPDMPVRWALFSPLNSDQALLATELGVWSTDNLNGGSTVWAASNSGLANVRTDMLQIRSSDNLVIAATHGRGLYSTDIFSDPAADFSADKTVAYIGNTVNFTDGSLAATSWSWDFGDGATSTSQSPSHTYTTAGKYTVTLTINSGADSQVKTDYMHILPNRGTPYLAADGGDFESNPDDFGSMATAGNIDLWERGTPSNAITTLNSASNGWKTDLDADIQNADYTSTFYTPSFNLTMAGTYTLRFRKSMEVVFANAPFGVWVEYSVDQGDTWTRLGTDNDPNGTNWYERGPSSAFTHSVTPGGYAFCNNYTNQLTAYDITFLAGYDQVCFRFNFICQTGWTASGYIADGFMIDDFEIDGESNDPSLPVSLQAFAANPLPALPAIDLSWRTQSEVNNSHWLVERADNGSEYRTIARLEGQGTTPVATDYDYRDGDVLVGARYSYRLVDVSFAGERTVHPALSVLLESGNTPGIRTFELAQNFPNPFNPTTTIRYQLPEAARVELKVYDLNGRLVRTLLAQNRDAGIHQMSWDGKNDAGEDVAAGIYLYRLKAGRYVATRKMVMVK